MSLFDRIRENMDKEPLLWSDVDYEELGKMMDDFEQVTKVVHIKLPSGKKQKIRVQYYNVPCAFDIETTSFSRKIIDENGKEREEKFAYCYIWQMSIAGRFIYGRSLEDFQKFIIKLAEENIVTFSKRIIVYVHNLEFEFQFIRNYFKWSEVFAIKERKVLYADMDTMTFKCSCKLSGLKLADTAEQVNIVDIKKLKDDLDYKKVRHSKTPLTDEEMQYCINDVQIIIWFIYQKMQMEENHNILQIPYTVTGYVRRDMRYRCLGDKKIPGSGFPYYSDFIATLSFRNSKEYYMARAAYMGGFTHANRFYAGETILGPVCSYDFTSSYPAVMLSECGYPVSRGWDVEIHNQQELKNVINKYCCILDVTLENVVSLDKGDNVIPYSKCIKCEKPVIDNGRIIKAKSLRIVITEIDFISYFQFYSIDSVKVHFGTCYKRGYLPKPIIEGVLDYYKNKTTLKDVEGQENIYQLKKGNTNSTYGMMCEDPIKDLIEFLDESWHKKDRHVDGEIEELLDNYNKSKQRFTFYLWGVYITAFARRNLFTGILEFGSDYIYSDTDSIKGLNEDKHRDYIEKYNENIVKKIDKCLTFYGLDPEDSRPKTIKGVTKQLGVWDYEGSYDRFKTLGAKRYMFEKEGKIKITVAGLNKDETSKFMNKREKTYGDAFDYFSNKAVFEPEQTGKLTHTYIDEEKSMILKDYFGNEMYCTSKSGIHLEGAKYNLSLSDEYATIISENLFTEYL